MKEALRFVLAIIILTTLSLAVAYCTGETMNRI